MTQVIRLRLGDCMEVLRSLPTESVAAVITDPPYGLEFMGKDWDRLDLRGSASRPGTSESAVSRSTRGMGHGIHAGKPAFDLTPSAQKAMQEWHLAWLVECYRVLQPGGVIKAFSASRTNHRLAAAMEEAGFVLPPEHSLEAWGYGSGFPKSLDISKAIDKAAGVEREVVGSKLGLPGYSLAHSGSGGVYNGRANGSLDNSEGECALTAPATPEAALFDGHGTALKPGWEPFIVGVKRPDLVELLDDEPGKSGWEGASRPDPFGMKGALEVFEAKALQSFQEQTLGPLVTLPPFLGTGVYALYYTGDFAPYSDIAKQNRDVPGSCPIYVGKASPPGVRKGCWDSTTVSKSLYLRLREHCRSIEECDNLDIEDFTCRFMICDLVIDPQVIENPLVRKYQPIWNTTLDGFGNHDPGKGRRLQSRSRWDILHPGRALARHLPVDTQAQADLMEELRPWLWDKLWSGDQVGS